MVQYVYNPQKKGHTMKSKTKCFLLLCLAAGMFVQPAAGDHFLGHSGAVEIRIARDAVKIFGKGLNFEIIDKCATAKSKVSETIAVVCLDQNSARSVVVRSNNDRDSSSICFYRYVGSAPPQDGFIRGIGIKNGVPREISYRVCEDWLK